MPYLQTTPVTSIKFPYGGFSTSLTSPCLDKITGFPIGTPGHDIVISTHASTALGIGNTYPTWISMINALNGAGVIASQGPNAGNLISSADEWMDVCVTIAVYGGHHSAGTSVLKCMNLSVDPCECRQTPCTCVMVTGPTGTFNNLPDCQATLNNDPCCGSWKCDPKTCDCVFIPNDITGFSSQTECYNSHNCCTVRYDEYLCKQIPIVGPVWANNFKCECVVVPAGTPGAYTGPNALFDCENDTTTCCSGTPQELRWKCNSDCNCVLDQFGPYPTLHDCQTAVNHNCCYTGETREWECVDFGTPTGCKCVQLGS